MKEIKFTVTDPLGIHARPAGILVKEAKKFSSKITVLQDHCMEGRQELRYEKAPCSDGHGC